MRASPRTRGLVGAGALLSLVLLTYVPAMTNGFVWDDDYHVTANPTLRDTDGLRRIWLDPSATPQYYPLTHTSFWLEYRMWNLRPAGYHVVNILLHAVVAILAWRVLRALEVPGAFLAAAIFAVHPVHVESVAWISERKNVLSGVLYMAAALAFLREGTRSRALSVVLFVGALLSKTVTATLPVALALVLFWRRGALPRRDAVWLGPMLLLGAVMGSVTAGIERMQIGAVGAEWSLGPIERVLVAGRAVWFYLGKLAWPADLTFIYPRFAVEAGNALDSLAPVAVVAAGLALWHFRSRIGTGPLVALLFFLLTVAPALSFVNVYPHRYSFVADHFQYLASLGPIALFAAGTRRLFEGGLRSRVALGLACALVATLAVLSWQHSRAFRDRESLWVDTLEKNPAAWIAHNNLGGIYAQRGDLTRGIEHFEAAIALRPDHAGAHANLGIAMLELGRIDEAIEHLEESLRLDPDHEGNRRQLEAARSAAGTR